MDFNAREALDLVMGRIRERDPQLAGLVQQAVDEGKLVSERRELQVKKLIGKRPSGEHVYERRAPLSDDEALERVVSVLRAHLVELPLCISSMFENLSSVEVAVRNSKDAPPLPLFQENEPEDVVQEDCPGRVEQVLVERVHEGMLLRDGAAEPLRLTPFSSSVLEEQKANFEALAKLLGK